MLSSLPDFTLFYFLQLKTLRFRAATCPRSHLGSSRDRFQSYRSLTPSHMLTPVLQLPLGWYRKCLEPDRAAFESQFSVSNNRPSAPQALWASVEKTRSRNNDPASWDCYEESTRCFLWSNQHSAYYKACAIPPGNRITCIHICLSCYITNSFRAETETCSSQQCWIPPAVPAHSGCSVSVCCTDSAPLTALHPQPDN